MTLILPWIESLHQTRAGTPLSRRPLPPGLLAGIVVLSGLFLVVQGVIRWRRLSQNDR